MTVRLREQRTRTLAWWKASTPIHGLHWRESTDSLHGHIEDIEVEIKLTRSSRRGPSGWTVGWDTRIRATDRRRLQGLVTIQPSTTEGMRSFLGLEDIQLGEPALDRRYRITGRAPSLIQAVCADEAVRTLLRSPAGLQLQDGMFEMRIAGAATKTLPAHIQAAVEPIRALVGASHRIADRLATRTGLDIVPHTWSHLPRFAGTIHGISVVVAQARKGDGMRILATHRDTIRTELLHQIHDQKQRGIHDEHILVPVETVHPDAVSAAVSKVVAEARTRWTAIQERWRPVTDQTGLVPMPDPEHLLPRFSGRVGKIPISARQNLAEMERYDVVATMAPSDRFPFTIRGRDHHPTSTLSLGDPILDGTVAVFTEGRSEEASEWSPVGQAHARALLARDAVRGNLLAVIKGYTGAHVREGQIIVPVRRVTPERLATAIQDAAALARSLSDQGRTGS